MNEPAEPTKSTSTAASGVSKDGPSKPVRWKSGLALALIWIIGQFAIWFGFQSDRTFQVMFTWYITPTMAFITLIWFLGFSRLPASTKLAGLGVLGLSVGAFAGVFRHVGYYGDMIPRFAFRWEQTAEERVSDFFASQPEQVEAVAAAARLEVTEQDWPQFRGPLRDGIVRNSSLRTDWEEQPPELVWKQPIGAGWSSFAIVGDYAFTQEQRGKDECVVCYDCQTGRQVWLHRDGVYFQSAMGGNGPRATPTVHDSKLYALGATGILNCLNPLNGELIWSRNILEDAGAENLGWGMSASPLIDGDLVIVNPGVDSEDNQGQAVIAYHRESGEIVWAAGTHTASYTAVRAEQIGESRQYLIFDADGAAGLEPETGSEIWRFPWQNAPRINVAQPIQVAPGKLFISSGYGSGSALLDLDAITDDGTPQTVWTTPNRFKAKFNDPVLYDGCIYGFDENILSCIDVETGKRKWKRGRYGYGQLLLHEDTLVILAESGELVLVSARPDKHVELAKFPAIEGKTWNHPVLNRGHLFVRNAEEAACFRVAAE